MSTLKHICGSPRRMGRRKLWPEEMIAKFPEGTFAEVARLKGEEEDRTDFVREAVRREIERRKRARKRDRAGE